DRDAAPSAVDRHAEIFVAAIGAHGGHDLGDAGGTRTRIAAFERCSDALAAAVAVQLAMRDVGPQLGVSARVALHAAETDSPDGANYPQHVLERCARLLTAGHGGQILASGAIAELVVGTPPRDVELIDLGMHHVSGLAHPLRVYQ